jgi:hypothetical protein
MSKKELVLALVDEFIDTYTVGGPSKDTFILKKAAEQLVDKYELDNELLNGIEVVMQG